MKLVLVHFSRYENIKAIVTLWKSIEVDNKVDMSMKKTIEVISLDSKE